MFDVFLALLFIFVMFCMVMLIIHAFTDNKEQKKLNEEMYEELKRRDEAYKRYQDKEKEADAQKKSIRTGTDADQFNRSIDVMHKLSKDRN